MKILVIEDDKIAQLGIKKIFGAAQDTVEIYISENGEEGLDFLKNHPESLPDFIILDLNMPKMNGVEFLKITSNHDVFKNIPVVVHTTSNNKAEVEACRQLGIAGYFVKSVDYAQYKSNLQTILAYWSQSEQINKL